MPFSSLPSPATLFPTYLVSPSPFRRRQSSIDSNITDSAISTGTSPPAAADSYLSGHASHLRCARCLSDLALSSQIISKGFTGRHGRAYLVAASTSQSSSSTNKPSPRAHTLPDLPNTYTHKPVPRQLVTGAHTVGDISCAHCGSVLGWKYIGAEAEEQKYKIGKFILETKRVCRSSTWEVDDEQNEGSLCNSNEERAGSIAPSLRRDSVLPPNELAATTEAGELEFDSQDEDECDALFAGQWTPQFAKEMRRQKRRFPSTTAGNFDY